MAFFRTSFQLRYVLRRLTLPRSSRIRNTISSDDKNRDERRCVRSLARVTISITCPRTTSSTSLTVSGSGSCTSPKTNICC